MVPLPPRSSSPESSWSSDRCSCLALTGRDIDGFRPAIRAYLRRRGFSGEDIEDLTQETLLRAYLHASEFRGANLGGWLYRIAGNLAIDHVRRQRRLPQLPLDSVHLCAAPAGNPESALCGLGDYAELQSELEALSFEQQELIRLRFQETHSVREIAQRLNCSTGAAKLRLFRAIEALRKRCGDLPGR